MASLTDDGLSSGWILEEKEFDPLHPGKYESILCLGNGRIGARSATEERYVGETRCTFVAGTFDRFDESEVTELPNCADVFALDIEINGVRFSLERGSVSGYGRALNLKTGELARSFVWEVPGTGRVAFEFRRFVSLDDLHLIGQRITITPLDRPVSLSLISGIDGRMANSGSQHFTEGEKRLYDSRVLQLVQTTAQSRIDFVINLSHAVETTGDGGCVSSSVAMDRRRIFMRYGAELGRGGSLSIGKFATIHTSRDRQPDGARYSLEELKETSRRGLAAAMEAGYDELLRRSAERWQYTVWGRTGIGIESEDGFDQLAVRFAQYHLRAMAPVHDNRMNIGAKGLTGEGYKGHTFWDTEVFILPYFTWTDPAAARSLLEYRYLSLPGARRKARENGYAGAMFPWESAWLDDGETTPVWGAADVVTGKAMRIESGFIEQHITADVAYGVWFYWSVTGDDDFLMRYGYEIIFECATFWASRLEWDGGRNAYVVNDVIGPDEYKEHVDNNAFTNHMAHWTLSAAIGLYKKAKEDHPAIFGELNGRLGLDHACAMWKERAGMLYLPQPNAAGVIPQDDTYLTKPEIDLSKYKKQEHVGAIFDDYNITQISGMQVSKQADVLLLLLLREHLFPDAVKLACWDYYEPRTLHDSSLSASTHSVLASDLGKAGLAYSLFRRVAGTDLGPDMRSSDAGLHAASLGGLWQCVVYGFGGVRMAGGGLRIDPRLPPQWKKLSFPIRWRGKRLRVDVSDRSVTVTSEDYDGTGIDVCIAGKNHVLRGMIEASLL